MVAMTHLIAGDSPDVSTRKTTTARHVSPTQDCPACRSVEWDHVKAHPNLGCADVGCTRPHPQVPSAPADEPSVVDEVVEVLRVRTLVREEQARRIAEALFAAGLLRTECEH